MASCGCFNRMSYMIKSTITFLIQSFIIKQNNRNPPPTRDLTSIVIHTFSSSSSPPPPQPPPEAYNDDRRISTATMPQNPVFLSSRDTLTTSNFELHAYHQPVSSIATQPDQNHLHHQELHPIIAAFQKQELGKSVLLLSVPIVTAFISLYNRNPNSLVASVILLLISFGLAATWNGILLREMYPRASNASEQIGVILIFFAFFGLHVCFLPLCLAWAPILCLALCILPFILAVYPTRIIPPHI